MNMPTKEEYDKAVADMSNYSRWIAMERKHIGELLDEIIECRKNEKLYEENYERCQKIRFAYEAYVEIQNKNK